MSWVDIQVDTDEVLDQISICEVIAYYHATNLLEEMTEEVIIEHLTSCGYKVTEDVGEDEE